MDEIRFLKNKWNFKDHIRMHNGETPYKCIECNKSFTQKGNLVKHERQHKFKSLKSRKIHKCSICTKCFTEKYNLKVRFISSISQLDIKFIYLNSIVLTFILWIFLEYKWMHLKVLKIWFLKIFEAVK